MTKLDKVPQDIQDEKTRQVRETWPHQLEHKQVSKMETEPGVRIMKKVPHWLT